jgi:bifunctional DNA-binding transcriptional regulator/antitoxin component of YhaV-PrlF toxin-antitoxin module
MPQIQLHYDGWLALPPAVRQRLGLDTGDRLEVELAGSAVLLRPIRSATAERAPAEVKTPAATQQPTAAAPELSPATAPAPVVKRGPGRPRKTPVATLSPAPKARGRRKAALSVEA